MDILNYERFTKQMQFLIEIDKMKTILRKSVIIDMSRRENDAEHSWHLAIMALILYEYAYSSEVDIARVLKMLLVHDIVEIYAGDTFAYDEKGYLDKNSRENDAAVKIFGILPAEQGIEYYNLWVEFDKMDTPDSIYAAAIDRFQPFILNYMTHGHTWKLGSVKSEQVYKRMIAIKQGMPKLWDTVETIIHDSIAKGYII